MHAGDSLIHTAIDAVWMVSLEIPARATTEAAAESLAWSGSCGFCGFCAWAGDPDPRKGDERAAFADRPEDSTEATEATEAAQCNPAEPWLLWARQGRFRSPRPLASRVEDQPSY